MLVGVMRIMDGEAQGQEVAVKGRDPQRRPGARFKFGIKSERQEISEA